MCTSALQNGIGVYIVVFSPTMQPLLKRMARMLMDRPREQALGGQDEDPKVFGLLLKWLTVGE